MYKKWMHSPGADWNNDKNMNIVLRLTRQIEMMILWPPVHQAEHQTHQVD